MKETPKCVIVTGRPGSGKSTLSRSLRELLHMLLLSRDEIKEGFVTTFGVSHDRPAGDYESRGDRGVLFGRSNVS